MRIVVISLFLNLYAIGAVGQIKRSRLMDAFQHLPCGDITGRLDSLIAEWGRVQDEQIVVVYYSQRFRKTYEFRKRNQSVTVLSYPHREDGLNWAKGIHKYLLARTATDQPINELLKKRVRFIDGGYREDFAAELWLVQPQSEDPKPILSSTIVESQVRFGAKRPRSIPDYFNCYAGL